MVRQGQEVGFPEAVLRAVLPAVLPAVPPRGEPMVRQAQEVGSQRLLQPAWRAYGRLAQEVGGPRLCPQLCLRVASLRFFSLNSLPVGGFSRVSPEPVVVFAGRRPRKPDVYSLMRKTIKDPPTQAVENITPLQKTSHICSWATADTGVASLTKCVQTDKSENYALPKNGAVGGHFATV